MSATSWLEAFRQGARKSNSIAWSTGMLGILYGAACTSLDISPALSVASSLLVFSGAVQFATLSMLNDPLPVVAIAVSALLVSNRLILMGVSIARHLKTRPLIYQLLSLHALTDGAWAATISETRQIDRFPFFVGAGMWVLFLWGLGTYLGTVVAGALSDELIASLRFSGVLFLALLLLLVVQNTRMGHGPWLVSAVIALAVSYLLPLPAAFLIGVTAGVCFIWFRQKGKFKREVQE